MKTTSKFFGVTAFTAIIGFLPAGCASQPEEGPGGMTLDQPAIDDRTRYRVLQIHKKRTAGNTPDFLDRVLEQPPFPVQRIWTDRGMGVFAEKVQRRLMGYGIKFRPDKPGSPHLNGKVERSRKTDLEEFYPTVDLKAAGMENLLSEWRHYYNQFRPHGSLGGNSPDERRLEPSPVTPFWDEVGKTTIRKRGGFSYKIIMRICALEN